MEPKVSRHRLAPVILFVGDILVILLFVFIGERDHAINDPQPLLRLLVTASYFALPWVIGAILLRAYDVQGTLSLRSMLVRTANGWLVAAPLGALIRSFANGSQVIASPFLVVVLLVGGMMLLLWRFIHALVTQRVTHARQVGG